MPGGPVIELFDVAKITPHPRNRRQGDIGQIAGMIAETGFHGAIITQRKGRLRICLAGWHRSRALHALAIDGYTWPDGTHSTYEELAERVDLPPKGKVPIEALRISDEVALKKLLQDNRANDLATYDEAALASDLRALAEYDPEAGLRGTGYDGDDVDVMLRRLAGNDMVPPLSGDQSSESMTPTWIIVIECRNEDDQRGLLEEFTQRGLAVRSMIGG